MFSKKVAGRWCGPGDSDGGPVVVKKKPRKKQREESYETIQEFDSCRTLSSAETCAAGVGGEG
jgi:hypothetical protein